jgi:hypothetical protein
MWHWCCELAWASSADDGIAVKPLGPGRNKLRTWAPQHRRQLCCSSVGHDCSGQSFGTSAVPGGRIL